jgi:hypothetical protein
MKQRIEKLKQEEKMDNEQFEREIITPLRKEQEENDRWITR